MRNLPYCCEGLTVREYYFGVRTSKHRDLKGDDATEYSVCKLLMIPGLTKDNATAEIRYR
jgi:hypothetical protein